MKDNSGYFNECCQYVHPPNKCCWCKCPAFIPGPPGPPGPSGSPGPEGPEGPQGKVGPQGPQGLTGEQGEVGPQGPQGLTGEQGEVGPQGPQGLTGEQGEVGPQGPQGPPGEQGEVGPQGPQGPPGEQGEVGPQGPQGLTGEQGEVGPQGPQGLTGEQGEVGPQGPQGLTGEQGEVGPQGPQGEQGPPGPSASCCCEESLKYALDQILEADPTQNISIISFNSTQTGVVTGFEPNGDVIKIRDNIGPPEDIYVSLCNTIFITFPKEPIITEDSNYNCTTPSPQCCCNEDVESALRSIFGSSKFPLDISIDVMIMDNSGNFYVLVTVYGICNGILWGKFRSTVEGNMYGAIPLCSIFIAKRD